MQRELTLTTIHPLCSGRHPGSVEVCEAHFTITPATGPKYTTEGTK